MISLLLMIGTTELLLIAALALLLFGGKKLPELMRGLGQGISQFKKGMTDPVEDNQQLNSMKSSKEDSKDEN